MAHENHDENLTNGIVILPDAIHNHQEEEEEEEEVIMVHHVELEGHPLQLTWLSSNPWSLSQGTTTSEQEEEHTIQQYQKHYSEDDDNPLEQSVEIMVPSTKTTIPLRLRIRLMPLPSEQSPPEVKVTASQVATTDGDEHVVAEDNDTSTSTITNCHNNKPSNAGTMDGSDAPELEQDDNTEQDLFVEESTSPSSSPTLTLHHLFLKRHAVGGHTSLPSPVTIEEVLTVLQQDDTAASAVDPDTGKLPLHVSSEYYYDRHDGLLQTEPGRDEATRLVRVLIQAHPAAMTTTDAQGNMPFVANIKSWITGIYEQDAHLKKQNKSGSLIDKLMQASLSPISKFRASTSFVAASFSQQHHRHSPPATPDVTTRSVSISDNNNNNNNSVVINTRASSLALPSATTSTTYATKLSSRIFPVTKLTDELEWSFAMLSLSLDEMGDIHYLQNQAPPDATKLCSNGVVKSHDSIRESRMALATNLVKQVPLLVKTILLLEDSSARERLWSMPIFRQVLVNEATVGPWLTHMLQKHGLPSQRAIDFFVYTSETKVEDLIGASSTLLAEDQKAFELEQRSVFRAIEALGGSTIPCLALLKDPKEIERAAATAVVWFIMDKELSSPFTVGLILIDLVLHLTLLLSFRAQANLPRENSGALLNDVPVGIVLTICAHYMIRKLTDCVALVSISPVLMREYFWNIWRILDLATIITTIGAVSWASKHSGQYKPGLNAIVLGLLWMKVLGFLKVVNRETATFILSLFEIIKDIRNFMVVLLVIILMFGDMIHVLISTDSQKFCGGDPEQLDSSERAFCSPKLIDGYLRTYVILMNDFDLQSFRQNRMITLVFVLYTLLGSIIMLNVLIAVINESYQKSRISSALLFSRARVGFVAEHTALQQFLQPGKNPFEQLASFSSSDESHLPPEFGRCFLGLAIVGRWMVLLSLLGTAASSLVYLVGRAVAAPKLEKSIFVTFVFFALSVLLTMAMLVVTHFCFAGLVTGVAPRPVAQRIVTALDFPTQHITRFVSVYIFGLNGPPPVGLVKTFRLIQRGERETHQFHM